MSKELFVSLTPHETKVAVTEDDQLSEIYFERENEYTLAGSIYKGRVTRVLPGMQSAFVDVGLERDAFLYVSDFFELPDEEEEFEPVAVNRAAVYQPAPPEAHAHAMGAAALPPPVEEETTDESEAPEMVEAPPAQPVQEGRPEEGDRGARPWRGRNRRRRGRRGRGPDSRFEPAAPGNERPERTERPPEQHTGRPPEQHTEHPPEHRPERPPEHRPERARDHYGPPPGYQPIILPGESISKYQRMKPQPPAPTTPSAKEAEAPAPEAQPPAAPLGTWQPEEPAAEHYPEPVVEAQPEPIAAVELPEPGPDQPEPFAAHPAPEPIAEEPPVPPRAERMNIAAIFGSEAVLASKEEEHRHASAAPEFASEAMSEQLRPESLSAAGEAARGTIEEEQIEEEEADLPAVGEQFEDIDYDELEEETMEPGRSRPERAPAGEETSEASAENGAEHAAEAGADESAEEGEEFDEEEVAEGEEGNERAELRAPAGTAGYQQRAQRPAFDRSGRGRRGGRRMRSPRSLQRQHVMISDVLKEGQEILVQIAKEPIGKKGARITSHIALPGRFLVYMPTVNHIGVSRKIESDAERQRLKRIVAEERDAPGQGGFIVRTAAAKVSEDELRADIRFLKNLWNEIKTRADNSTPPALIYHDLNLVERVLRDQVTQDFSHIWVDSEQEYERILRFINRFQPGLVRRVKLYTKTTPLFEQFNIQEEINKALKSKVWLKSGGYIVINQTEALVAIDVNTGKYVGKTTRLEDTIVKTNVDAIKEIVRQIRLRDLGGIIVIDFIDMDERRNRQKVMQALEEALKSDRAPSKVLQFNDFGLVAITRKRVKHSLERTLGETCPYCTGTGIVKSVDTVCNEIYTELRKMAKSLEDKDISLRVNPEVAKALKANNARWLNDLEELTNRTIIVKSDPAQHQEQFDIV